MAEKIKLSELITLKGTQHIIIGNSGSGKTFFTMEFIKQIKKPETLFVFGTDENEWQSAELKSRVQFIHNSPFENNFLSTLSDCIIVFDDYRQDKAEEDKFYKFANYQVRHKNICFILITHSIFKSNLYSKILSSPSIFLTTCSSNLFLVQKYDKMFGTNVTAILKQNIKDQSPSYRPILYITPHSIINSVEELIKPTANSKKVKMFKHDKTFYLLDTTKYKFEEETTKDKSTKNKLHEILADFEDMYPVKYKKLKKFITLLFEFLTEKGNLNHTDIEVGKTRISFYDFIISSQDFSKKNIDSRTKNVLVYLKKNEFKVPRFTVQNQHYKTYIT